MPGAVFHLPVVRAQSFLNIGKSDTRPRFMQADPWWSSAMAVNVYLVFFHNIRPSVFRQYAWIYCLICFGGPLITAIALLSIQGDPKGPIFGDAVVSDAGVEHGTSTDCSIALVLDRQPLESCSYLLLLYPGVDLHHPIYRHLRCRRIPCLSPSKSITQRGSEQCREGLRVRNTCEQRCGRLSS